MDYYLKAPTEAQMNETLVAAGVIDKNGDPAAGINIDVIGPFTRWDCSVEPPVPIEYPEWHVNLRSEFEIGGLDAVIIPPPHLPFRVWA